MDNLTALDQSVFFFFNLKHTPFWDAAMSLFTQTQLWLVFFLTVVILIIRKYRAKAVIILVLLALAILVSDQLSNLFKDLLKRPRPTHDPEISNLVHYALKQGGLYGFFSAHASNTFTAATFSAFLFKNRWYSLTVFLWALLVSYTRIYLGLHFPSDILTGWIVGFLTGLCTYRLLLFLEKHFLMLRMPKIPETRLDNKDLGYILVVFITIMVSAVVIVIRLRHYHWIS